jgi:REP element-mobilizing transposase RayT
VINEEVDMTIKDVSIEISKRYEIRFIEIGTEGDHVHFLVQSVPKYSPTKIVTTIKSIIAKEVYKRHPEVKEKLWGGEFWTDGYYISTVGKHGDETVIVNYVKSQGTEEHYKQLYRKREQEEPSLFD